MPKNRDENGRYIPNTGLNKQQIEAIMLIVYEGKKGKEVYEAIGVPHTTYYHWYHQDLFKEELEKERKAFRRQLKNKAWKRLEDVIDNASYRDVIPALKLALQDNEENYYLSDKLDINSNTKQEIVISILNDEEEV